MAKTKEKPATANNEKASRPSIVSKWRGLRGLGVQLQAPDTVGVVERHRREERRDSCALVCVAEDGAHALEAAGGAAGVLRDLNTAPRRAVKLARISLFMSKYCTLTTKGTSIALQQTKVSFSS